jgi:hypothetical protein
LFFSRGYIVGIPDALILHILFSSRSKFLGEQNPRSNSVTAPSLAHVRFVVLVKQIARRPTFSSARRRTCLREILSNKWRSLLSQSLPDMPEVL